MEFVDGQMTVDTISGKIYRRQGNCLYVSEDNRSYTLLASIPLDTDATEVTIDHEGTKIKFIGAPLVADEEESLWTS